MSRRARVVARPSDNLAGWYREMTQGMNEFPNMSVISTSDGPESNTTGDRGHLAIDVGSAATTLWVKTSGTTTTGWTAVV